MTEAEHNPSRAAGRKKQKRAVNKGGGHHWLGLQRLTKMRALHVEVSILPANKDQAYRLMVSPHTGTRPRPSLVRCRGRHHRKCSGSPRLHTRRDYVHMSDGPARPPAVPSLSQQRRAWRALRQPRTPWCATCPGRETLKSEATEAGPEHLSTRDTLSASVPVEQPLWARLPLQAAPLPWGTAVLS